MIEKAESDKCPSLLQIANLLTLPFDDVLYIKRKEMQGIVNYKVSSMLFEDYQKACFSSGNHVDFKGFVSQFPLLFSKYSQAILMLQLGAKREVAAILSGLSFNNVKALRKKLNLTTRAEHEDFDSDIPSVVFSYIESNQRSLSGIFSDNGTTKEFNEVLILLAENLKEMGIVPPFEHLIKALVYHLKHGSLVSFKGECFYSTLLAHKLEALYTSKGKLLEPEKTKEEVGYY